MGEECRRPSQVARPSGNLCRALLGVIGSLWLVCGFGYIAMAAIVSVLSPAMREGFDVSPGVLLALGILIIPLGAAMSTMVVRNGRTKLLERSLAAGIVALLIPGTLFIKATMPGSGLALPGLFALAIFGAGGSLIYQLVKRLPRIP